MAGGIRRARRAVIRPKDLRALGEENLARLLAERIAELPYHRQKEWARRHVRGRSKDRHDAAATAAALLDEIEVFCAESRSGGFVSWVDDRDWYDGDDGLEEGEEFQEWVTLFTDLMKRVLDLARLGKHKEAARAYRVLLELLKQAGETTDILGNHGAPEDSIRLDFEKVVEGYTRSLLSCGSELDQVIDEMLPLAKRFRYTGGFTGLAKALDPKQRGRLEARLTRVLEGPSKADRLDAPAEAEGLIALAKIRKDHAGVLRLKERFAPRNATYLQEVLVHYRRRRDWEGVARLAQLGVERFGNRGEFAKALIEAREALGDSSAAQDAQIAHFLEEPGAADFVTLKRRSEALSNWDVVFDRLIRAAASSARGPWLRIRLLLAEGREQEVVDRSVSSRGRPDLDEMKLGAKYAVARLSDGADLGSFRKLGELQHRLKREKDELYDWLRLSLRRPGTLSRAEYARLAAAAYRRLVDLHLDSGKPSRASPAAHYCAIVGEISRLTNQPELWADLLRHLRERHGRKRLVWTKLTEEGCPVG